jgi:hypothetical protein
MVVATANLGGAVAGDDVLVLDIKERLSFIKVGFFN